VPPGADMPVAPLPGRRSLRQAGQVILWLLLLGLAAAVVYVMLDVVLASAAGLGPHSPGPLPHPVPVPNPPPPPPPTCPPPPPPPPRPRRRGDPDQPGAVPAWGLSLPRSATGRGAGRVRRAGQSRPAPRGPAAALRPDQRPARHPGRQHRAQPRPLPGQAAPL